METKAVRLALYISGAGRAYMKAEVTDWIRRWHVLRFHYYMTLHDSCLCPELRKKLFRKAEKHIVKFEATFQENCSYE